MECGETPAQNARVYKHTCGNCMGEKPLEERYSLVEAESTRYLESIATQQQWSGEEPALQILMPPATTGEPLPAYSEKPDYLSPHH